MKLLVLSLVLLTLTGCTTERCRVIICANGTNCPVCKSYYEMKEGK